MKLPRLKSKLPVRGYVAHFTVDNVKWHGDHKPRRIVLHSTESDGEGVRYGRDIVAFWRRQGLGYGAHFVVARDGCVVNCAPPTKITWHVENRNTGSVGIEQAGYARYTLAEWYKRERELDSTARIIAALAHAWNIPLELDDDHGIATHAMESRHYGGSHSDPGKDYPLSHVLGMARSYRNAGGWRGVWDTSMPRPAAKK